MEFSSFLTCNKNTGLLYFRLPFNDVYSRTVRFCEENEIVESHDISDNDNILVFLSDNETVVELRVSRGMQGIDYVSEILVLCLHGDTDSTGYYARFCFDLYNYIIDLYN